MLQYLTGERQGPSCLTDSSSPPKKEKSKLIKQRTGQLTSYSKTGTRENVNSGF